MSKMKKIAGLLLAVVMVVAMSAVAWADDDPTYTITIKYSQSGHTYEAYQIFKGDLYETYSEYTGTEAPTDGRQLYTYDATNDTYETATFDSAYTGKYYYVSGTVLSNVEWGERS